MPSGWGGLCLGCVGAGRKQTSSTGETQFQRPSITLASKGSTPIATLVASPQDSTSSLLTAMQATLLQQLQPLISQTKDRILP